MSDIQKKRLYYENPRQDRSESSRILPYYVCEVDRTDRKRLRRLLTELGYEELAWNNDEYGILVNTSLKRFASIQGDVKPSDYAESRYYRAYGLIPVLGVSYQDYYSRQSDWLEKLQGLLNLAVPMNSREEADDMRRAMLRSGFRNHESLPEYMENRKYLCQIFPGENSIHYHTGFIAAAMCSNSFRFWSPRELEAYLCGEYSDETLFYPGGQVRFIGSYFSNFYDSGEYRENYIEGTLYYESRKIWKQGEFQEDGLWRGQEYYPSGQLMFDGRYQRRQLMTLGPAKPDFGKYYAEDGRLLIDGRIEYKDGKIKLPKLKSV